MRNRSFAAFAFLLVVPAQAAITVENLEAGEEVRHPVVVVRGRVDGGGVRAGVEGGKLRFFPAFQSRYVALADLKPGRNFVTVQAGADRTRIRIDYRPMRTPYAVRTVWVQASDESDDFTPPGVLPHGDVNAKLDVAMKLIQAFTAEAMHEAGYGRKTFPLEFDATGRVVVHRTKLPQTGAVLRATDGNRIWGDLYGVLDRQLPGDTNKWCAFMAFSGFENGKTLGHFALGGGKLAGFGGGTVAYWPASLDLVARTFADRTPIDPTKTFEDSAGRHTVWANVATAFGATIHELGHTFGLPHSPDPRSVMSRGFDFFNRTFMAYEPPRRNEPKEIPIGPNMTSRWDPYFAARLNWNPWFQPDGSGGLKFEVNNPPTIQIEGSSIVVRSSRGLRVVGIDRDDIPPTFQIHDGAVRSTPKEVRLDLAEARTKMRGQTFRVTALDTEGNQSVLDVQGATPESTKP